MGAFAQLLTAITELKTPVRLSIAAKRMAAQNVLVKDLQGVETLGEWSISRFALLRSVIEVLIVAMLCIGSVRPIPLHGMRPFR